MKSIRKLLSRFHRPPSTEDDDEDEDEVGGAKAAAAAAAKSVAATRDARDAVERGTESFGSGGSSVDSRPSIRKGSRRKQRAASRSQRSMEKKKMSKRSLGKRLLGSLQWMHIREDVPSRRQRSRFLQSMASPESIQIWKNNLRTSVLGVESIYEGSPYVNTGFVAVPRHGRYIQGSSLSLRPSTRVPMPLGYINEEKSSNRIMRSSSRSLRPISATQYLVHEKSDMHPVTTSGGRNTHGGWTQFVGYSEEVGTNPQSGIFAKSSGTVQSILEDAQGESASSKGPKSLSPRRMDGLRRERKAYRGDEEGRIQFLGTRKDSSPDFEEGRISSPSGRKKTCINIVDDARHIEPPYTLDQAIEDSVGRSAMRKKYGRDEEDEEGQAPFSSIMKRAIRPNEEKQKAKISVEKMKHSSEDIELEKRMSSNISPIIMRGDDEVTGKGIMKYPKGYSKQDKARSVREVFGIEKLESKGKSDFNDDIRLKAMRLSANKAKSLIHGLEDEGMSRRAAVKAIIEHQKQEDKVRFQKEKPSHDRVDKEEGEETYINNDDEELKIRLPSNKTSTLILRMEEEGVTGRATVKSIMDQMKQQDKMRLLRDVPSSEKNEGRDSATFTAEENAEEEVKIKISSNKSSAIIVRTEDDPVSRRKSATEQMKQPSKSRLSRHSSSHEKTEEREKSEMLGREEEADERKKILSNKGSHIRQVDDELKGRPSQKSVIDQKKLAEKVRSMKAALEQSENASISDIHNDDEDKIKQRYTRKSLPDEGSGDEMNEAMRRTNEQCLVDAFIRESVLQSEKRLAEEYPKTLDDYLNIPIREAGKRSWSRIKAKYMNNTERPRTLTQRSPIPVDEKSKREDSVRERVSSRKEKSFDDMVSSSLPASSKGKRVRNSTETTSPVRDVVHRPRIPLSSIGRLSSEDSENEEWDQIFDAPPKLWAGLHASSKPPRF